MTYEALFERLGGQAFFDLAMVSQLFGEPRASLRVQLYRWASRGRLLPLRRGMYAWPESHRRVRLNPAALANALHTPSYLSGLWALGFYGLIPEQVVVYTSVTTRVPRRYENPVGTFEYRHIKSGAFFGYQGMEIDGATVQVATAEKALLDFWHLSAGPWTPERMAEMRFQNFDVVKPRRLEGQARRFRSPRLIAAVGAWNTMAREAEEGTVAL
ncbi:MAG: hypothetical protein RBT03_02635 [Kiritimatiellia bacterium]|jgi:hypothetical protein|nr:hypothetical protein [Kiritimatiellia bacterium]